MSTTSVGTDARVLASRMLALTFGDARVAAEVEDWEEMFALAVEQRCAALMWQRVGAAIRANAPAEVTTRWRERALAVANHGSALLALLSQTQALLSGGGVHSVALKGAPLALRLYGAPIARPVGDLDLYIPAPERQRARELLHAAGWMHVEGGIDEWEVMKRIDGDRVRWLDLLSQIPKHLPRQHAPPPESEVAVFEGVTVRMHSGPGVPTHLAIHLAKHEFPPLLWFVDFMTAWTSLSSADQDNARKLAHRLQTHRYLTWALDRAAAIDRAVAGEFAALDLLGIGPSFRSQPRRWRRELVLAGSFRGAAQLLWNWIFPRSDRTPMAWLRVVWHRMRHPARWLVDRRDFRKGTFPTVTARPGSDRPEPL